MSDVDTRSFRLRALWVRIENGSEQLLCSVELAVGEAQIPEQELTARVGGVAREELG